MYSKPTFFAIISETIHRVRLLLILTVIVFFVITSCAQYRDYRYEYINRHEFEKMKQLYLVGVNIIDNSDTPKTRADGNNVVYYSTLFVQDSFINSFIEEFNKTIEGKNLNVIEAEKLSSWGDGLLSNRVDLGLYQNKPLPQNVSGKWIREFHPIAGGEGYVFLEFETSLWAQEVHGFFKVYTPQGKVIWREQIRDFSTYIVNDKESPYLIRNRQMRQEANNESFYQEIKKIYRTLGILLAKEFSKTL